MSLSGTDFIDNKKQQGSTLVIALFVIMVFLLLASTLARITAVGDKTLAYEVLGTRAYAAANAGAEVRLQQLFPLNAGTGVQRCNNTIVLNNISAADGLQNCSVSISCRDFTHVNNGVTAVYYHIESTGSCLLGAAESTARTIVIEARNL